MFPKCNQQDATFLGSFSSIKRSTGFRRFLRPSPGAQTVHTASGICQTMLLPAAIMELNSIPTMTAAGSSNVLTTQKLYVQFELLMMGGGTA
jgi:hypothetical protein